MNRKIDPLVELDPVFLSTEGEQLASEVSEFLTLPPKSVARRIGKFLLSCLQAAGEHYSGSQILESRNNNTDKDS